MLHKLNANQIGDIDEGRLGIAIDNGLRTIAHDLKKRPGVEKARTLTIKISCTPVQDEDGGLASMDVQPKVDVTVPATTGHVTSARVDSEGEIVWNDHSPDNVNQGTLDQVEPDTAEGEPDTAGRDPSAA